MAETASSLYAPRSGEDPEALYRRRIALFSGLEESEVDPREVEDLFNKNAKLARSKFHLAHFLRLWFYEHFTNFGRLAFKYLSGHQNHGFGVSLTKRLQQFAQQAEGLLDICTPYDSYQSFGRSIPIYAAAIGEEAAILNGGEHTRHLLVGALTPDTLFEYDAFIHHYFPKAQTFAIDLRTFGTFPRPSEVDFLIASAGNEPFKDGSFDFLYTNFLLDHLTESDAILLFQNSARILRPGGSLIGIEAPNNIIPDQLLEKIQAEGFSKIMLRLGGLSFKDRRSMEKVIWYDGQRVPAVDDLELLPLVLIKATK